MAQFREDQTNIPAPMKREVKSEGKRQMILRSLIAGACLELGAWICWAIPTV